MSKILYADLDKLQWHSPALWIAGNKVYLDAGEFSLRNYPFLKELYLDPTPDEIVVRKASQMGFTTWAVLSSLWFLVNPLFYQNVLYILPTDTVVRDFSAGRLNPIVEESPAFEDMSFNVDNVALKRIGRRNFYLRGSKNKQKIREVPAAWIVLDEVDAFDDLSVISLIKKRAAGSKVKFFRYLSNPTAPEVGIDALFLESDQRHWHIKCEHCGRWQELDFFKNIDLDYPERGTFCRYCKKSINRLADGEWVPYAKSDIRGYYISQVYSVTVTVKELVEEYKKIKGEIDRQVFYNMSLGLPYVPKGGQLSESDLLRACGDWGNMTRLEGDYFMGIDVGNLLHWVIITSDYKVAAYGAVENFEDLARIIAEWDVFFFVIDALPEKRKSLELCREFEGRGAVCYYKETDGEKEIEDNIKQFNRDRELWLDTMFSMIKARKIRLPKDLDDEFRAHLTALIRVAQKNNKGQTVIKYLEYGKPDHYAHALNYAIIAKESFQPPRLRFL